MVFSKIRKACVECGLNWINKYQTTKYVRHSLKYLKQSYYAVNPCEEATGKITQKILHALYHKKKYGNPYESYTWILQYCFQQKNGIDKDADIQDSQKVKFLIYGTKAKNDETTISKVPVIMRKQME